MKKFPKWASIYLSIFCHHSLREELEGDMLSNYNWRLENASPLSAKIHFLRDVLFSIRFVWTPNDQPGVLQLFRSSFKIYIRNIRKEKNVYLFHLSSLFIGILFFLAIYSYHRFERSFDTFYTEADQIYRLEKINHDVEEKRRNGTSYLWPAVLKDQVAEVSEVTGIINSRYDRSNFQYPEGNPWHGLIYQVVQPNFFEVLDFSFVEGDASTALDSPEKIVITEELRYRLFGEGDGLNKVIYIRHEPHQVGGVVDLPANTHFEFDYVRNMTKYMSNPFWDKERVTSDWHYINFIFHYVKLTPNSSVDEVESRLNEIYAAKKHVDEPEASFLLHRLDQIHLDESTDWELSKNGNKQFVNMIMMLGVIMIILVSINYSFTNIARAAYRFKELGLRALMGSSRRDLAFLIIFENILTLTVATFLAYQAIWILQYNLTIELPISLHIETIIGWDALLTSMGLIVIVSVLSGLFPIMLMNSIQPLEAIKGHMATGRQKFGLINSLMMIQVFISVGLIIGMLFIYDQIDYILEKDPGFEVENIGYMERYERGPNSPSYDSFKESLLRIPGVKSVTNTAQLPLRWPAGGNYKLIKRGEEEGIITSRAWIGYDYFKTLEINMKLGREFSTEFQSDSSAIIISASAADALGLQDPIGEEVTIFFRGGDVTEHKTIVGVVEDFNYRTFHNELLPHYYILASNAPVITINFDHIDNADTHAMIKELWPEFAPNEAFNFTYMKSHYRAQYEADLAQRNAVLVLAFVVLLLAAMGVFGVSAYLAKKEVKQISIRKVLGARISALYYLLIRQYIMIICIAFFGSIIPVYFAVNAWLDRYAYRIDLSIENFFYGFLIMALIITLVISCNILKVAFLNPVNTLKDE